MLDTIREGFGQVLQNKFNRFAIVGVILISALFGLVCVIAFWSPEDKLKDFPVAVINLDEGEYGEDIVENLKQSDKVKWEFYAENIFQNGIENTEYSFGFLIPENFSASVQSAQNGKPQPADIIYYSNMRKNYLLSQFSRNVTAMFETSVSASITREYATGAFDSLYGLKDGLAGAAGGAENISAGAVKLQDGVAEFSDGIAQLNNGAATLQDNNRTFTEKMGQLTEGAASLKDGVERLSGNTADLAAAVGQLAAGAETLQAGTADFAKGVEQLNEGAAELSLNSKTFREKMSSLADGASSLKTGLLRLDENVTALSAASMKINTGATALAENLNTLGDSILQSAGSYQTAMEQLLAGGAEIIGNPELTDTQKAEAWENLYARLDAAYTQYSFVQTQITPGIFGLMAGAADLQSGTDTLRDKMPDLLSGVADLVFGAEILDDGAQQLQTASESLYQGSQTLAAGTATLQENATLLSAGAIDLQSGTDTLHHKMPDLTSGVAELVAGAANLDESSRKLQAGSVALRDGMDTLADGATALNQNAQTLQAGTKDLAAGVDELHAALATSADTMEEKLVNKAEDMGEFIAAPVTISSHIYGEIQNYGTGFAPLFMSMGLWIGALMLFFLIPVQPPQAAQLSRVQIVWGRYIVYATFGALEALVITGGALLIGVEVISIPVFMLFAGFLSLVFIGIIQFIHLLLGDLMSKGLCVILVILQVSAAGGSFPVDLMGSFFIKIHPFLPFSYSIDGFREIISGGNWPALSITVAILLSLLVVTWILSGLSCKRTKNLPGAATY
jgi:putative membrane protein